MEISPSNQSEIPSFEQGFPVGLHPDNPNDITYKEPDGSKIVMYYNKQRDKRIFDFMLDSGARIVTLDVGSDENGWVPVVNLNINPKPWTTENPQYKLRLSHFDYEGGRTRVARIAVMPNGEKVLRGESIHGSHDLMRRLFQQGIYTPEQVPNKFDFQKTVDSLIHQFSNGDMSPPKLESAK